MTPEQAKWLADQGYDPSQYDIDPASGQVYPLAEKSAPIEVAPRVSTVGAFGANAARSLLPSLAGLAAGAYSGTLAGSVVPGWGNLIGGIAGGLAGGYGVGKAQDALVDKFAPEANKYLSEANEQHPIASYLGGFAPNALALRPSVQGLKGLTDPLITKAGPRFAAAAGNVGANVAGSTAAQLISDEPFDPKRFAADVALGSLFSNPNKLGRRLGLHSIEQPEVNVTPKDLRAEQIQQASKLALDTSRPTEVIPEETAPTFTGEENTVEYVPNEKKYERWWMRNTAPDEALIKERAKEVGMKIPRERLAEISKEPYAAEIMAGNYKNWPDFLSHQLEKSVESALAAKEEGRYTARDVMSAEEVSADKIATEGRKQKLSLIKGAREQEGSLPAETADLIGEMEQTIRAQQSAEGEPLSQEALDKITQIAAKRGLTVEIRPLDKGAIVTEGSRSLAADHNGLYFMRDGKPVMALDPLNARINTAVEELGHDVFARSARPGLQKSLAAAVEENETYREVKALKDAEVKSGRLTPEMAEDIAREEGLMSLFREKYPEVSQPELASWWGALKASVKSMARMKLSPQDAMAWMLYATHEHTPWSGSVGNATSRAQLRRGKLDLLMSEIDKVKEKGGPYAPVADAYKNAYNTRDFKLGQWSEAAKTRFDLTPEQNQRLHEHLAKEMLDKKFYPPAADIKPAYDEYRQNFQKLIPDEYNQAGFQIRSTKGTRARGIDPYYYPLHTMSPEVKEIFASEEGIPQRSRLQQSFLRHREAELLNDGYTAQAASAKALTDLEEELAIMRGDNSAEAAGFAGARRPQGYTLPPDWVAKDYKGNVDRYIQRSATDYALQKHIESDPTVAASLGSKTFANGAPINPLVLASAIDVKLDPAVQNIVSEFNGAGSRAKNDLAMGGLGRLVSTATIGPASRAADTIGTAFKGLAYLQPTDYLPGLVKYAEKLSNWGELAKRSYESGLNKRDASAQLRAVMGTADIAANGMTRFAENVAKYTGLGKLEQAARVLAQGWGETLVEMTRVRANAGDKASAEFLSKLSPDWQSRPSADLAAQFGRVLQGTYDMRSLPAWALDGPVAPYLTWSKWSMGQYNNFVDYAIKPAIGGNVKPLIGQMLIGVLGGQAVQSVLEWVNNRESKDVNWNELAAWMQQNSGELGQGGSELLAQKLLTLAQRLGTFGFAGDIAKTAIDSVTGSGQQGVATAPAADLIFDTSKRTAAALKALDDGEDFGRVLRQLVTDLSINHGQVARIARNWLDEDENLAYGDKRRRRLFDELRGKESTGGNTFAVSYSNLKEKDFDKASAEDVAGMAGDMIVRAAENSSTPEEFKAEIRKITTRQNRILPGQKNDALQYLDWIDKAEPGAAKEIVSRFTDRRALDKFKNAMIMQGAGMN